MTGVPVVWLAPDGAAPSRDAPSAQAGQALDAWARARGIRLSRAEEAPPTPLPVDMAVADRVEEDLARAREALVVADPRGAERALAHAEGELLAHPELPQAAWLLAEVERGWSMRWQRLPPADPERAAAAWRRAEALDDGRTAGIGETPSPPSEPAVTTTLAIEGGAELRVWLDGRPVAPGEVTRAAGRHQLVATHEGAVVYAAWVTVAAGAPLRVRIGPFTPCTFPDLATASVARSPEPSTRSVRADAVRCPQWIAASPAPSPAALYVAVCEPGRCGPVVEWRATSSVPAQHPPRRTDERGGWPAWATWTLVGAGAVALTGAVLVAAGVFDPSHPEPRFVNGGVKAQGAWVPLSF